MTFEEKKAQYAKLLVRVGAAVREGQKVSLSCPIEEYEFGRTVIKEAYLAGAADVSVDWVDDITARLRYDYAPQEVFETFPEWESMKKTAFAKNDYAFIHITGSDPEIFKGIDQKKMTARQKAAFAALREYYKMQSTMAFKWTVAAIPTKAWATKVFPGLSADDAVAKLWDAIFKAVRIGDGDPVEKWTEHAANLKAKCEQLNKWQLKTLHYTNSLGTDFTVGLVENHRWEGGADIDKVTGGPFFANMPTEEVFTMPHREKADGVLYSALPLSYRGSLIENFKLVFKNGEVVDYDAEKGKDVLKSLIEDDEGSRRLGECALVSYPSPISAQGILFLETLFDENATCHFALGNCYETNLIGGPEMEEEELKAHGGNISMDHVDFMVGTADLKITGVTKDDETVTIFENGKWAF